MPENSIYLGRRLNKSAVHLKYWRDGHTRNPQLRFFLVLWKIKNCYQKLVHKFDLLFQLSKKPVFSVPGCFTPLLVHLPYNFGFKNVCLRFRAIQQPLPIASKALAWPSTSTLPDTITVQKHLFPPAAIMARNFSNCSTTRQKRPNVLAKLEEADAEREEHRRIQAEKDRLFKEALEAIAKKSANDLHGLDETKKSLYECHEIKQKEQRKTREERLRKVMMWSSIKKQNNFLYKFLNRYIISMFCLYWIVILITRPHHTFFF